MRIRSTSTAILVGGLLLSLQALGCHSDAGTTKPRSDSIDGATALADAAAKAVNALPIPRETVEQTVNPGHLPSYAGATGVIEGTILVTGDPAPPVMGKNFDKCPAAASVYSKTFRETAQPDGSRVLADTIVAVTGYTSFIPEKTNERRVTISNCAYSSRTIDLTFGQALLVKNEMGTLYAPELENQLSPAVMVATPGGDPVRLYPKTPGRYRLMDRVGNNWLEADVYVLFQPLHAVSDVAGHFRIEGVPVGKLKVGAQHPAIVKSVEQDVDVKDGVIVKVTLTLVNDKAAVRPPDRGLKPILP